MLGLQYLTYVLQGEHQKGDPEVFEDGYYSPHNHYVNYPVALHPHNRQKRFVLLSIIYQVFISGFLNGISLDISTY